MKSMPLSRASSWLVVACLVANGIACGSSGGDEGDAPGGDTGAAGGDAGKAGSAGTAGKAGSAGAAGSGAKGGAAGGAGASGTSGSAGAGGSAGGAGAAGGAGKAGGAGASGSAGAAGSAGTAGNSGAAGSAGKGGAAGAGAGGAGNAGNAGNAGSAGAGPVVGLVVKPTTADLVVTNGAPASVQLDAIPVYKNGTQGAPISDGTWTVLPGSLATITSLGKVTTTGAAGGEVTASVKWMGLTGDAKITIKLVTTLDPDGVAPSDKTKLDSPGANANGWIYPYDGTVFPRGLAAPKMMWDGYAANDTMLVTMSSDYVTLKAYFKPSAGAYTLPPDAWTQVTESGKGGKLKVTVSRLAQGAASATQLMSHTWTTASGSLRGTVYYWAINTGRVMRIKPGGVAEDFLKPQGMACPSCHTVSANGKSLVMNVGNWPEEASYTFDLVGEKTAYSGLSSGNSGASRWAQAGVSADGAVVVQNWSELRGPIGQDDGAFDAVTGAKLSATGLEGRKLHMPAFSPDNKLLAYVTGKNGSLAAMDWDAATKKVSNDRTLVGPGADPKKSVVMFPGASPDHKWIVYQRGNTLGSGQDAVGDLYLASADTPGVEIPLDALNGTSYPFFAGARDHDLSFEPTFAPQAAGGYYWVVFHSRRTYGNALTGPAFCGEGCGTKQLWVAAIDLDPKPGVDPSHPAFWVPGQETSTLNMRGYWALEACRDDGASCSASSQCCSGLSCLPGGTCGVPPGQTCKPVGAKCTVAAECCGEQSGYQCLNGFCTEPKPLGPSSAAPERGPARRTSGRRGRHRGHRTGEERARCAVRLLRRLSYGLCRTAPGARWHSCSSHR